MAGEPSGIPTKPAGRAAQGALLSTVAPEERGRVRPGFHGPDSSQATGRGRAPRGAAGGTAVCRQDGGDARRRGPAIVEDGATSILCATTANNRRRCVSGDRRAGGVVGPPAARPRCHV